MNKTKKTVVITGVTSFLGSSLAKKLIARDFLVYGIIRPDSKKKDFAKNIKGLKVLELDFDKIKISDIEKLNKNSNKNDITFFHFAWGATLDRSNLKAQLMNIDYSMKVLTFAKMLGAKRFIFAGSQAEYSNSAYGMAKLMFSELAEDYAEMMKFIHLRIFSIYGENDRETSLLKTIANATKKNIDVDLSSCNYPWNFLYIDDFTEIMYMFIMNDVKDGIYDIASDDTRFLKDYVIEMKKIIGGKNNLNFGKRPDSKEMFAIPDISNMKKAILDFKFTKFSVGVKRL